MFGNGQRREPQIRMRVPVEGGMESENGGTGLEIPDYLKTEIHPRQQDTGPVAYAPPARRSGIDGRLAELHRALEPQRLAPPPPLSEEARKMVSQQDISRAETVRDSLRATAAARLAEFDAWVKTRLEEMIAEAEGFKRWAEVRRSDLEDFSGRIYAWGDDHVAKVTAEQEERARLHHRDVDIVTSTQALLERHGVPLPPPKPAVSTETVTEAATTAKSGEQ